MANQVSRLQMQQMCNDAGKLGFRPERLLLLDQRLEEWSKNPMTPSIAVRVLRHGQEAFTGAYGIKGPDMASDSLTPDTIFPVCSLTKPVISTLLCIMQEEGLIDLFHKVRHYIPEFTGDKKPDIRIWHLLTHTSGIIDKDTNENTEAFITKTLGIALPKEDSCEEEWNEALLKVREKMGLPYMEPGRKMRHDTQLAVTLSIVPTHKPQEVMSYCNTGFHIAKEIIDRISKKPIDEFAAEKLFKPLKMQDSHFLFPQSKLPRYVTRSPEYLASDWLNKGILDSDSGPGGLKTTVLDMTRFGQMFLNKGSLEGVSVLSPASVREMTSDHNFHLADASYNEETVASTWGLGWNLRGRKKDDSGILRSTGSFEHGGFGCCKLLCDPEADIVAAYFTVCRTDTYFMASNFNNIVLGAINGIDGK
ncbi:MAG: beta-lactamase family protein [Ruminiclostridium sp.]|nr:beta-lactamase family protein [Ruminiclostridium sp.]